VEDEVDVLHRPLEAVAVADVADQKTEVVSPWMPLALVELLGLVSAKDADNAGVEFQQPFDKSRADRSRSSGDEDPLSGWFLERADRWPPGSFVTQTRLVGRAHRRVAARSVPGRAGTASTVTAVAGLNLGRTVGTRR
jgi:hypothetical protein